MNQREIKFRAWDKERKEMFYSNDYTFKFYKERTPTIGGGYIQANCDILMQFTGLKDKNGKEIYEGDIVLGDDFEEIERMKKEFTEAVIKQSPTATISVPYQKSKYKVEYNVFDGRWEIINNKNQILDLQGDKNYITDLKVIGNIYEDAHLLDNENMKA